MNVAIRYRKDEPADPDWVLEMIARYEIEGLTYRELGDRFGVSHMTAYNTVKRWQTWATTKEWRKKHLLRKANRRSA